AGGAGDEEMRHAGEVGDDGLAADGLAEAKAEAGFRALEILRGEKLAQVDRLAARVGQLDADGVLPRDDGNAAGNGAHRARDIVGKAEDAGRLDARRRLQLVKGDDRPRADIDDLALDAEVVEDALEQA